MEYILIRDAYGVRCGLCMDAGKEEEERESNDLDLSEDVCGRQVLSSMSIHSRVFRNCTFRGSTESPQLSHLQCQTAVMMILM